MRQPRIPANWVRTLRHDAQAGVVLGVQSVPDGLATGVLAGLSPLSGLYGYMVGTLVGAAVTSSAFMVVQGTGAMAMVIADVPALHGADDQARAVATLAVLTGLVMLRAGLLKLGSLVRFVSNAVLIGFMSAVGVNMARRTWPSRSPVECRSADPRPRRPSMERRVPSAGAPR